MFTRRELLIRALRSSPLLGFGATVPGFIARTAHAAEPGKDTVLVVVELTGGNDGLNTVIPYADDLYHKARRTLRHKKDQVIRLDDHVGLHPGLAGLQQLLDGGQLAVVQGVGYPNSNRSHFEAMDVWQSADPKPGQRAGWLARTAGVMGNRGGPILHVGAGKTPLAVAGGATSTAVSLGDKNTFRLNLGGGTIAGQKARRQLLEDVSASPTAASEDDLIEFVGRRQMQTLTAVRTLGELFEGPNAVRVDGAGLAKKFQVIAGLIAKGLGTRIFYVALDGFDTHSEQAQPHQQLLTELADGIGGFFRQLQAAGHADRVRVMTFSEFGRRVAENGSRGTDHGAGSCLFVAGPSVKGGVVGKHPDLADLDEGDLKPHTDFRRVYATLLDAWLDCDSTSVLGAKWEHVTGLGARK